jgi:gamma-glutamyl-gamma-aminobutyraldehyde dehydrogenase
MRAEEAKAFTVEDFRRQVMATAHGMTRDIDAGVIWVNCYDHGDMTQPWGGFKQSGTGRDKCLETLLTVSQTKSVWMHLG